MLPAEFWLDSEVAPGSGVTQCDGFWNKTGYVCKIGHLERFVAKEKFDKSWSSGQIHDSWLVMQSVHFKRYYFDFSLTPEETKKLESVIMKPHSAEDKRQLHSCLEYLQQARIGSFCSTCSAKNYRYYFKQKAVISLRSCAKMVAACDPLLEDLLPHVALFFGPIATYAKGLSAMIDRYHEGLKTKPDAKITATLNRLGRFKGTSWKRYQKYIKEGKFDAILFYKGLKKAHLAKNKKQIEKQMSLLCMTGFRLHRSSGIYDIIQAVKETAYNIMWEADAVKTIKQYLKRPSRKLERRHNSNWLDDCDINIEPASSFTDILIEEKDGTLAGIYQGQYVVQASPGMAKPMNLSLTFA